MSLKNHAFLCCAFLAGALAGCQDEQHFAVIRKQTLTLGDFERRKIQGQAQVLLDPDGRGYTADVSSEMIHPEFVARWTNLKREVEVDLYVMRYEDYAAQQGVPPPELENVLWSSVPPSGPQFGETRPTQIHLHPSPGRWVLFFFNPLPRSPLNEAELSAEVLLNFFD
jgi:hypothetical protein